MTVINMNAESIITELRAIRKSKGLTQQQVGNIMAKNEGREKPYTKNYVSAIEKNVKNISFVVFLKYCNAVGIEFSIK